MRKINWNDWDRQLRGPSSYERYNALAKIYKKLYYNILRAQLIVLLLISLLSSIPSPTIQSLKFTQYAILVLIIVYMCILIIQYRSNYMPKWQKSRFMAESCLSEAWFFMFGFDIYNGEISAIKSVFLNQIKKIKTELKVPEMKVVFNPEEALQNEFPEWVVSNRSKDLSHKMDFYLSNRIQNQIDYYSRRTDKNTRSSEMYFYSGLLLNVVGIVLAILSIGGTVPTYTYIALFTTLSAAFVSWTQSKQYEEISAKSSVAIDELNLVKEELILLKSNNDNVSAVKSKVYEAEKLISREHKVKRNND
ncbi:MAG: DUF4231 domain-containing protein [Moheibacter sp.]